MTLCLFVGTSYFSYIVGSVCGVLAKLSEKKDKFNALMSELNTFMVDARLDTRLCARLRAYFRYQNKQSTNDYTWLLEKLTPALRGAVALEMHSDWIEELPVFSNCPKLLLIRLSFLFTAAVFPPDERLTTAGLPVPSLMVLRRGLVIGAAAGLRCDFAVCGAGKLVGADALRGPGIPARSTVLSLTHCDFSVVGATELREVFEAFPDYRDAHVRRWIKTASMKHNLRTFMACVARARRLCAPPPPRAR